MSKQPPKDKENRIQEKLKQLLRINKNVPQTPAGYNKNRPEDFILTAEVVKVSTENKLFLLDFWLIDILQTFAFLSGFPPQEIGSDAQANQRIKTLKRLSEEISGKRMAAVGLKKCDLQAKF